MDRSGRIKLLQKALSERILVLDGAMGTAVQSLNLEESDYGGAKYDGCGEHLALSAPAVVEKLHRLYLDVGADIVETNTFSGSSLVLDEYDLGNKTYEINRANAEIARQTADSYTHPEKPRFVAGSIGPTTKSLSVTGGIGFDQLVDVFFDQVRGLYDGQVDYFLIETSQDTRNIKAALLAMDRLHESVDVKLPIAVSGTIEPMGTMLAGQNVEALWASLAHRSLLYIGLNCATGPEFMTDHIRSLSEIASCSTACVPNAGLPDEDGNYLETPEMMSRVLSSFIENGWVNLVGGCCGTTPEHIRAFVKLVDDQNPRVPRKRNASFLSGIDYVELDDQNRPLLVGERTNVIGSRKFKKLILNEDFERAAEIARAQIRKGAQIVDVCLANPDRDELEDMKNFLSTAIKLIRVPLMIDTTDSFVLEEALKFSQGKALINSINLEDGEKRFEEILPFAQQYGAALVVGTIDEDPEQGMGVTRERKLEIARRSYKLLTEKYEFPPEDIYFDPLVFPCGTGDEQYVGSAVETIEGLRLIKEAFPLSRTVLGISNVSFGLPTAGREVLNSVFLYHCTKAGLDVAIVNTQLLQRYPSIPDEEKKLAENLLWNRGADPIGSFANAFRDRKAKSATASKTHLSLEERLADYILNGTKEGLIKDLELARKEMAPLKIINGPLMDGMDEVGRLFNDNELIVAEVLQSAEVMKAAVAHLEQFMTKADTETRGVVLLATVKGDVHDIGKNLVDIILSNNGFKIINLGIKIPPEQIIEAVREHRPDLIGLSGLLVKSAQMMVTTAEDLSKAKIRLPILVGGAALSKAFTMKRIAPKYDGPVTYASDAMNGLTLAKKLMTSEGRKELLSSLEDLAPDVEERTEASADPETKSNIVPVSEPPTPPDSDRHVLTQTPIEEIWAMINPRMLLGRHLGLPNSLIRFIEEGRQHELSKVERGEKAIAVLEAIEEVKALAKKERLLQPKAVYQFFDAGSEGNDIALFRNRREIGRWRFPRQAKGDFLCLSDYLRPLESRNSENLGLFVVTAGYGIREKVDQLKGDGRYLRSHVLAALALESAEAYAEWLHRKMRRMWHLEESIELNKKDLFKGKYPGKRYSFGYPACPDLEGQKLLFDILKPEEIGVELTDGYMMDPEASVSALVFHHPEAKYFSV